MQYYIINVCYNETIFLNNPEFSQSPQTNSAAIYGSLVKKTELNNVTASVKSRKFARENRATNGRGSENEGER